MIEALRVEELEVVDAREPSRQRRAHGAEIGLEGAFVRAGVIRERRQREGRHADDDRGARGDRRDRAFEPAGLGLHGVEDVGQGARPPAAEVANAEPGIEIRPFQHHDDAVGFTLREPFEVAEGIAEEPDLDLDSSPRAEPSLELSREEGTEMERRESGHQRDAEARRVGGSFLDGLEGVDQPHRTHGSRGAGPNSDERS